MACASHLFRFGGIDILVNNASAVQLLDTERLGMKGYDLMHQINVRGTFAMSKACIPYLSKSSNPHILNMSPPLSMKPEWFLGHTAYTMSKFGMSMVAMGLSAELAGKVLEPIIVRHQAVGNRCKRPLAKDHDLHGSHEKCCWLSKYAGRRMGCRLIL